MASMTRVRSQRGAELIELAIVTPLLLLMLAALFDFAMMFRAWETVTNAAREGARIAVLTGYKNTDVVARVQQYMNASGMNATCTLKTYTSGKCPASACSVCYQSGPTISTAAGSYTPIYVTVEANQSMPSLSVFAPFFGGSSSWSVPVASTTAMRAETTAGP